MVNFFTHGARGRDHGFCSARFRPKSFFLLNLENKINHLEGDICNADDLHGAIQSFQPEVVFHLAAQAIVKKSYIDPSMTLM